MKKTRTRCHAAVRKPAPMATIWKALSAVNYQPTVVDWNRIKLGLIYGR